MYQTILGRSSLCYLTVLKCQLPATTYSPPAVSITRLDALLTSPNIKEHVRYFCRCTEQAEQNAELMKQEERPHGQRRVRIHHGYEGVRIYGVKIVSVDSQFRLEPSRWRTLLALSSITSSVTSFTVTSVSTTTATSTERLPFALTLATHHTTRRSVGSLLLDVGSRDNLSRKVKPFAEVIETLGGESVVVVLP